jgi:hypothetical protein
MSSRFSIRTPLLHCLILPALLCGRSAASAPSAPPAATFRTAYLTLSIDSAGRVASFADARTGRNYAATGSVIATVSKGGRVYRATEASAQKGALRVRFGDSGVSALIRVESHASFLTLQVVSVEGDGVEEMAFPAIDLTLKGTLDEPFDACALALNLDTDVQEIPGPNSTLRAIAFRRFGLTGAKAAIVAAPVAKFRRALKAAVLAAPDLPHSPLGGPWALDAPINRESYLFNFNGLSEKSVDRWIALARALGVRQIDFNGGFRFGDYRPDPKTYPQGMKSLKAVVDRLHAAGLQAGLHTYSMFLDKRCEFVSPTPDRRLAKAARFTLREPLAAAGAAVPVAETTAGVSTVTGFFVRNSVALQIDDELITFTGAAADAPWAFTGCTRGAFGTKPAAHAAGAPVYRLREMFGLFVPDPATRLLEEVADRQAQLINTCGFDMVYLDALDGSYALGEPEDAWHHGARFVFDLWRRLKHPVLMEMSTFHHLLWCVRSRMGAWDCPQRGYKRFVDMHAMANEDNARRFLPSQLGWWATFAWDGIQPERSMPDDLEYMLSRCAGYDCGTALLSGFDADSFAAHERQQRLARLVRRWEDLRRSHALSGRVRALLRTPGDEYTLEESGRLVPVQYSRNRVEAVGPNGARWEISNRFRSQPAGLRIETLLSALPYDAPGTTPLADLAAPGIAPKTETSAGVKLTLTDAPEPTPDGKRAARLVVSGEHTQGRGAWAVVRRQFTPTLNLTHRAIGVWIRGDGQGETLNFQIGSPVNVSPSLAERYVVVDFTGWRYFALVEPESERLSDFSWPYCISKAEWSSNPAGVVEGAAAVYQPWVDYAQIGRLSIWMSNLPAGRTAEVSLGPIVALATSPAKLRNPSVTIAGRTIAFPVDLETGSYLEYRSATDCKLYGRNGDFVRSIAPRGDAPIVAPGANRIELHCDPADGPAPRATVTVIARGRPIAVGP